MIQKYLDPIFAPFRQLRSKVFNIKQMPAQFKGEVARAGGEARMVGADAQAVRGAAQGARGKVQGAQGQVPAPPAANTGRKMGWFSKKTKCDGCGQKLHPTWEECPYCGYRAGAPPAAPAAAGGAPQRTMALDIGHAAPAGTGMLGWFIPLEGSLAGELFPLRGRVSVGTGADNDIVIPEQSISGHHCEFVGGPNGFQINDLGSTNGAFVNDKRIQTHDLIDNDNVTLGRVRFKFKSLY